MEILLQVLTTCIKSAMGMNGGFAMGCTSVEGEFFISRLCAMYNQYRYKMQEIHAIIFTLIYFVFFHNCISDYLFCWGSYPNSRKQMVSQTLQNQKTTEIDCEGGATYY
jgi:hypothetical protein